MCTCTRSCARANDAKIVRTRDLQCNTEESRICNIKLLKIFERNFINSGFNEFLKLSSQDITVLAYDAVQVINEAINSEPCSSINGTSISSNDKEAMLTCLKKVSVKHYELFSENLKFSYKNSQQIEFDSLEMKNYRVPSLIIMSVASVALSFIFKSNDNLE